MTNHINATKLNPVLLESDFKLIPRMLIEANEFDLFTRVLSVITKSNPTDVIKCEYVVGTDNWIVYHGPTFKMTINTTTHAYHCFFDKLTGMNVRFGKTVEEDADYCELSPEILDLEVSVNGCAPVKGSENCKYCYKCNTNATPTNMSFDTFKKIICTFPINLSQIAFGITGLQTNPELPKMFEYCRQVGIIPNLTTVGADMNDQMKDMICKFAGACAVSCYTGAKELCYKTIKELHDYAKSTYSRDLHVNMHILVSNSNREHLFDVLHDIANGKVDGLRSVVLLRIKPVGRATKMDCKISLDYYREIVKFCLEHNISFGFDSCSAKPVAKVLEEVGKGELSRCCEPCESSKLSSYINVNGEYWSCSFAERTDFIKPINVLEYNSSIEWWNSDEVKKVRFCSTPACESCPIYDLDAD